MAERDELNDKVKQLQKDLTALQKKAQETENKLKRDLNQALESKKHIQVRVRIQNSNLQSEQDVSFEIEDKNGM